MLELKKIFAIIHSDSLSVSQKSISRELAIFLKVWRIESFSHHQDLAQGQDGFQIRSFYIYHLGSRGPEPLKPQFDFEFVRCIVIGRLQ